MTNLISDINRLYVGLQPHNQLRIRGLGNPSAWANVHKKGSAARLRAWKQIEIAPVREHPVTRPAGELTKDANLH